jgi:hypothetical protein
MKLYMNGICRNTESQVLIGELKRAGYVEIKEPVEIPAPEVEQELPPEKAVEPEKVMEPDKKTKKVVKDVSIK